MKNGIQIEKEILKETKGLPNDALSEILNYTKHIKEKFSHKSTKKRKRMSFNAKIDKELNNLQDSELKHLEEEFKDYKEKYPLEN